MGLPSPKPQSNTILTKTADNSTDNNQQRSWSDLPIDLLPPIAKHLGLIDLLSFRAVCIDWHSASATASAQMESANENACLLLYGEGSKCTFFHQKHKKKYTIEMPELEGATCLASNQGWLLLFQEGSIIFFCPFSRAKIHLPPIPDLKIIEGHVAAFSAPPTCKECVVSVINWRSNEDLFELNVLTRGANTWTKYEKSAQPLMEITGVTYVDGTFYYCYGRDFVATFSLKDGEWKMYRIINNMPRSDKIAMLPFHISRENYGGSELKKWIKEDDDDDGVGFPVPTCGTVVRRGEWDMVIHNENFKSRTSTINNSSKGSNLKGVWIQPRFFQIPPNQSWSL